MKKILDPRVDLGKGVEMRKKIFEFISKER